MDEARKAMVRVLEAINVDPDQVTGGSISIEPGGGDDLILRWQGSGVITRQALAEAMRE